MATIERTPSGRVLFTEEMKKEYTILAPQMAPIHFELLKPIFATEGYKFELLDTSNYDLIHEGLKYVHNDTCIPALLVIGQLIDAVKNGGYNVHKIALIISQTGGGCRASNYIHLLRQALEKAGYGFIPVISMSPGIEKNPGFKLDLSFLWTPGRKAINALFIGDMMMQLINEVKPYEVNKGDTEKMHQKWNKIFSDFYTNKYSRKWKKHRKLIKEMASDFGNIKVDRSVKKPRVGVVGEIYVKYSPLGNNNLEALLEAEGCEVVVPAIMDFAIMKMDYRAYEVDLYGGKWFKKFAIKKLIKTFEKRKSYIGSAITPHGFHKPVKFEKLISLVEGYVDRGNRMGEGWLLTAEMLELIEAGAPNIVCTQPFGCLPNHISGKGMFKKIKQNHPEANIVPIDYDASSSEVNQVNRIKLMVSNAYRNL